MSENRQQEGAVLSRYCPKLGHPILFSYCMQVRMNEAGEIRPCNKIMDCWWETFDIQKFLQENMPAGIYRELVDQIPQGRGAGLFDAIQQALTNKEKDSD